MAYQMLEFQKDNLTQPAMQTEMVVESSEVNGNQLDQNFFQDNNDIPKKRKKVRKAKTPYSPTLNKIKARNYLSNLAYRRICDKDLLNASFIIDMLYYICMDLKPFFLNTTYSEQESRDMIKMLWEEWLPKGFYEHIKKPENFELLNSERLTFKHAKNIVYAYVQLPDVWSEMAHYVSEHHSNYQYVYSLLFPKSYLQRNKYGQQSRIKFALSFNKWQQRKMNEEIGKNPFNFNVANVLRHPCEQIPIKTMTNSKQMLLIPRNFLIETKKIFRLNLLNKAGFHMHLLW